MAAPLAWPVLLSGVAGLGAVGLLLSIWPHRDKPGGSLFLAAVGGQVVWSIGYAIALLVFDRTLRWALAVVVWESLVLTGISFFGFALAYTGRAALLRTWWVRLFAASAAVVAVLVPTNPMHGLVWTSFTIDPVWGLSTVAYDFGPVAYLGVSGGVFAVLVGSLLLFDTVVSYGRPYRSEAVAVGLSTVAPSLGLLAWLFQVGPVPRLNLTTVLFVPHVALDLYAFVGSDMFEFHPATRRAGERAAIDDLGSPVLIVDREERIVRLNPAAEVAFGVRTAAALTKPLEAVLGGEAVDPAAGEQTVSLLTDGQRRDYRVTPSPLRDGGGRPVGYTLLCQDVTRERQRKQRLEVLNRILRHNLRNDITVVNGFLEAAADRSENASVTDILDRASEKADDLVAVGDKARTIERVLEPDADEWREVDLGSLGREVATDLEAAHDDATVAVDVPASLTVETRPALLEPVIEELVENAIVHDPATDPSVEIRAGTTRMAAADPPMTAEGGAVGRRAGPTGEETGLDSGDDQGSDSLPEATGEGTRAGTRPSIEIAVLDEGPGVPAHELAVLQAGGETDLTHGSGLGLWLVHWGVRALGGSVHFDVGDDGTTAVVRLPA